MELFIFGSQAETQPSTTASLQSNSKGKAIKVPWSSWCDAVILTQDASEEWTLLYTGTGLTPAQSNYISQSKYLRSAFNVGGITVNFFGSAMHDGLRGHVISSSEGRSDVDHIVLFATDTEIEAGEKEVHAYSIGGDCDILDIKLPSGGNVLLSTRVRGSGEERVVRLHDLAELRRYLKSDSVSLSEQQSSALASSLPVQWCENATTSTALMPDARVYTYTSDPRYPECLGRPYDGRSTYELVPFLSETEIIKIASGGYLSAALSSDGELYLWGQVCPDSAGQLAVLRESPMLAESTRARSTGVDTEGEQDEFVKCLRVRIDDLEARVYDVAIGHGHIWIAVEVVNSESCIKKRAIFTAGDNSRGQLAPKLPKGFVGEFGEVVVLRDKQVMQLVAAGWWSHVVTRDDIKPVQA